jgi:hypothetical protein
MKRDWSQVRKLAQTEISVKDLPADLRTSLKKVDLEAGRLQRLEELQNALDKPWAKAPDVDVLQDQLATLLEASGDPVLTTQAQRYLAYKAACEGYLDVAQQLLPLGPAADTAPQLRDLKSIAGGDKKEGARILGELDAGKHGPAAPDHLLTPEADPGGFRPRPKEPAGSGLPPLGGKKATEKPLRSLKGEISERIKDNSRLLHEHLHVIHDYGQAARDLPKEKNDEKQEEQPDEAVAKCLGRDLTPAERILVGQMHRRGKKPAEMAGILRQLP